MSKVNIRVPKLFTAQEVNEASLKAQAKAAIMLSTGPFSDGSDNVAAPMIRSMVSMALMGFIRDMMGEGLGLNKEEDMWESSVEVGEVN